MKKYWQSIKKNQRRSDLKEQISPEIKHSEGLAGLIEDLPFNSNSSRRDFLKFMGYGISSAVLISACQKPLQKAIPFLNQPADIIPGKASNYASTFFDGSEYCPIVVKVRDGRPIKIEGNDLYKYTLGGTTARVQASVLSLYDNARIKGALRKNKFVSWTDADKEIVSLLKKIKNSGKEMVLLTSTIFSPSTLKVIEDFKLKFPNLKVVNYDTASYSGMVDAYDEATGKKAIPYPLFEKANVIVSFGADFLGTWFFPAEFTLGYASKRRIAKENCEMSRHIQFEPNVSLTGSNADERIQMKPSEESFILANLYNLIAEKTGSEKIDIKPIGSKFKLNKIAEELLDNKGKSIVISGSNDKNLQKIIIAINRVLGNYGNTFDTTKPMLIKQGSDNQMLELIERMKKGKVGAILFNQVNPCFDYFASSEFVKAMKEVDLTISFSGFPDETITYCDYICPSHHFLESWNDFQPRTGIYSISQPCINSLFDTRQMQESLLIWADKEVKWDEYIKNFWESTLFHTQNDTNNFDSFWVSVLRNGFLETSETEKLKISADQDFIRLPIKSESEEFMELHLVVPLGISSGYHSNNPWLQELPDPISRVTWDNYASVSPRLAEEMKLQTGDIISIGNKIEIPVFVQPGQAYKVLSVALNYGRKAAGKVADNVGVNMNPLITKFNNNLQYFQTGIDITKTSRRAELALTQTHNTMEGRLIVRETTRAEYTVKPNAGNEFHEEFEKTHQTLYPEFKYDNFHWGMGVDLNLCTGCGACVVACQAENNVAVVGKEQITKRRIMHWIRIDRYYTGSSENPSVLFQPVMCQHCDNAPCENVCPVAATNHSNEGLNQMVYNRCVGTRYCINNCPYKVRRFNWLRFVENPKFDFNQNSKLGKMVLNPDVVVRERGVVEKCSFCVQRIQEKKLNAKLENRQLQDGEIIPACVQACPAKAIIFGDLNDPGKRLSKWYTNERNYFLLEELHTLPKVGYLTKVRNKEV